MNRPVRVQPVSWRWPTTCRACTCRYPTCVVSISCFRPPSQSLPQENRPMPKTTSPETSLLLRSNLKQLRLPTMLAEHEKLAREAAGANEDYQQFLLRLTELEVATRHANALRSRI